LEGFPTAEEGRLTDKALFAAFQVRRTGKPFRLDPMPPAQRRVIHQALANHPDVATASEGEGSNRRVVVVFPGTAPPRSRRTRPRTRPPPPRNPVPMTDTIAAIATPLGAGGLGVLRLSGPLAAFPSPTACFGPRPPFPKPPRARARLGELHDGGVVLDQALALAFRAPHSYTGEDVVEFSCHGGPALLRAGSWICCCDGAPGRPARASSPSGRS
jgi:hypothetical protein